MYHLRQPLRGTLLNNQMKPKSWGHQSGVQRAPPPPHECSGAGSSRLSSLKQIQLTKLSLLEGWQEGRRDFISY